jgi:hypothetical protein
MAKVNGKNHIYSAVPPYLLPDGRNNRNLPAEEQIVIKTRAFTFLENDAASKNYALLRDEFETEEASKKYEEQLIALMRQKFVGIDNLEIDGIGFCSDFDTFLNEAPSELVFWFCVNIKSTEQMNAFDIKNLPPRSVTA